MRMDLSAPFSSNQLTVSGLQKKAAICKARSDQHLWAAQYSRDTKDIFQLQQEIAKNIASEIEVIITPEEQLRIEKIPAENLEAYDYFLKGLEQFYAGPEKAYRKLLLTSKKL